MTTILALDISSSRVGVVVTDGGAVRSAATWRLEGNIAQRCQRARALLAAQLYLDPDVDAVAIESPVSRFAKALIPQARVSGAVLALLAEKDIAWTEVAPTQAKKALAGSGSADKAAMIAAAERATGLQMDEHQADAYGLARCVRVEVRS